MKFAIGIPTINRVDLLKECLEDLAENLSDVEQIYITDNGNQNIIAIIPDKIRNITRLYTPGKNLGCSGSWNDMMRRAFTSKKISVDYLLILNDDIIFGHTTTDLKAAVEKHPDALIINSGGWSCFMVSKECYELVGPFDEKFYPAYFEDNDYAYRISLLERPNAIVKARPEFKPKVFRSSMSLKKDPTLNKTFGENKKYYERKWGGLPCHEKYKTPFNRPKEVSINEIKVLWSKLGTVKKAGSSVHVGKAYHEVPFSELSLPTHRHNLNVRVNLIKQEMTKRKLAYKGKYGLDIGCSVGGLSFSMTKAGAKQVLGVDYDPLSINVGNAIESHYKTGAVFLEDKVSLETLPALIEAAADPATGRINFCLWFSQFMWLLKQTSLEEAIEFLRKLTNVTDVLWFESSQGDMAAGDAMRKYNLTSGAALEDLLRQHTPYQKIINLGNAKDGWGNREVILCYAPIDAERFERKLKFNAALQETKNMRTKKGVTSLVYINGTSVIKQYKDKYLPFCFEPELDALKALAHESGNISRHFPKVMFATSPYIEMSHCGSHLSKGNMPADHERQAQEILEGLKHRDIVHRDIWPGNLMVKNDIIQLIDFGWATSFKKKEIKPKEAAGLGQRWKAKKGFDDTYSLNESFKSILA